MQDVRLDQVALRARQRLRAANLDTPDLDAQLLLEWATATTRLELITCPERSVPAEQAALLEAALTRRCQGEPVHRIIGMREFYGLPFQLSPDTLEPRPDTETLIELVLPFIKQHVAQQGVAELIDMGTGTGAIAISLLAQVAELHATAVDISAGALAMARINAVNNGVASRFAAVKSNWFSQISGKFHFIVSNPPYIPAKHVADLSREVREHDPLRALDGGADGLDFYRSLAAESSSYLTDNGMVAVEIGAGQYDDVKALFAIDGFALVADGRDLAGHYRAMVFQRG